VLKHKHITQRIGYTRFCRLYVATYHVIRFRPTWHFVQQYYFYRS